jgi:predicted transcriptional regulator
MGWFFSKKVEKEEFNKFEQSVQTGFNSVKKDIGDIGAWIKHLHSDNSKLKSEILELEDELSTVKDELENLKNILSIVGERPVFKQKQTVFNKQTLFKGVLNSVQTGVQTAFLHNLSTTERAIIFILLNSDMKLSYEDIAAMLGKRKATIRGQINSIRQKSEGLIEEVLAENNKKRVFIPEKVREKLLKQGKVKVKHKRSKKE